MSIFKTKREIPATPGQVFAAIKDPARLAKWWGPDRFTNKFERFDFTPGGRWVFSMIGPDGKVYPNESVFDAIDSGRQVVIRHVSQPNFVPSITLQDTPTGTMVIWEQAFADEAVANAVRDIVVPANEQNLDRLGVEVRG